MKVFKERRWVCTTCGQIRVHLGWEDETPPRCTCGGRYAVAADRIGDATAVHGDDWPGGKVFENGFPTPQTFYSKSAYHRALRERGLQVRGDGEEGRWATISAESLEKAKAMVSR